MIVRILYHSFIALFLIQSISSAQKIESISIVGNDNFSSSQYKEWISFNVGDSLKVFNQDSVKSQISFGLSKLGYYHSDIKDFNFLFSDDSSEVNIIINVDEGKPTHINSIKFDFTLPKDTLFVKEKFSFYLNNIFNQDQFDQTLRTILDFFEDSGFPFATITIESVYFFTDSTSNSNKVDIAIKIDQGKNSTIQGFEVVGNTKTKKEVIIRETGLSIGDLYSQEKLEEIPKQLNRLKFFEPVEQPEYYYNSKQKGILKIKVKEKQTNNFDGILGYFPSDGEEPGYLTGMVNISLRNIFGTGRSAAFKWQKFNRFSQDLSIRYLEPWLFGYPFNVSVGFYQRLQDSTYVQRKFEGNFQVIASDILSASVILESIQTIPTNSDSTRFTVFNSSSFTTGFNFLLDTRNDYLAPISGMFLLSTFKYIDKSIDGPTQFLTEQIETKSVLQKIEIDFGYYYQFIPRNIFAIELHGKELRGNNIEYSDLYEMGGTNSLRGYREKQFRGNRIAWTNIEYRLMLTPRTYTFLFYDYGYFLKNADPFKQIEEASDFLYGYGLGLNLETGLGIMAISFAFGKGDSFADGKIHFGLINEF